jgi:hypothetical protein
MNISLRIAVLAIILIASTVPCWADPAFDAFDVGAQGTGNLSWTHTPIGTPRAVIISCSAGNSSSSIGHEVSSVTYGGIALSMSAHSPLIKSATESGAMSMWFLGTSIPTGAQTVSVTVSGSTSKRCSSVTVTAASDTSIDADATLSTDATTDPTITLPTTTGVTTFVYACVISGDSSHPGATASYTEVLSSAAWSNMSLECMRRTANPTGGNITVNWSDANSEDAVAIAVAVREGVAATCSGRLALIGVGC